MARLPVITGFGGINAAGRSSFHHGYRRMVLDALPDDKVNRTLQSLSALMGVPVTDREFILNHTLVRKIEAGYFDTEAIPCNKHMPLAPAGEELSFVTRARNLPEVIPPNWKVTEIDKGRVRVDMHGASDFLVQTTRVSEVRAAGQLPTGFDPGALYASRSHPRGLQLSIFGASDAIQSVGIGWETLLSAVRPDQVSVYASSAMAQLDENGNGGLLAARLGGKRVTSKQLALGLADMPSDFVNAYVLGSIGSTGPSLGACATFLYNLRAGVQDIRSGRARIAIVGAAEAPITPDVIDGYATMGALATDAGLMKLDGVDSLDDAAYRRACRPFGDNCGFTVAEATQFAVLMDDELALELGASIYGSVPDVFINADGYKKSISSPGAGNYLTVAKAAALVRQVLGEETLRNRSFVQAHGTGTPQNRVTESHILNEVAKAFGIDGWPVAAIKAYLGHTIASASGDQLVNTLGVWNDGILPGIATVKEFASDIHRSHLSLSPEHREIDADAALLNSKGFGGNNATATVFSPTATRNLLTARHGKAALAAWQEKQTQVAVAARAYDEAALAGQSEVIYRFDHNVLNGEELSVSDTRISLPGYANPVDLKVDTPYADWLSS
ncbi:acetoacetyl-[acyl-carrier protein] synthase [Litorivivens lipolytica]|uniref:Acetoacetyl-[acyl-carrier protein] synthase n=1 Tax=Litorivivens lipolytica TaxID=1524264 RepID=A0A7W4W3W5_9GAMM|nr:acetoacetyl-[acyl-carrier protein] synthase [Litorivivens lipolytica]